MDGKRRHRRNHPVSRAIARPVHHRDLARRDNPTHPSDLDRPRALRAVASALSRQARRDRRPHLQRPVGSQRRDRVRAQRSAHVRQRADRPRPALRHGGRVHRADAGAVGVAGKCEPRGPVLAAHRCLRHAKAALRTAAPGECDGIAGGHRLRRQALRSRVHHQPGGRPRRCRHRRLAARSSTR